MAGYKVVSLISKLVTMKKIFICLVSFACAGIISAQQRYTLEECREMALKNNAVSENARLNVQSAVQSRLEAFTTYFPSAEISGVGFKANDPVLSANMGGLPLELLKDGLAGAVTVVQPVFTGGKVVYGNRLAKLGVEVSRQQLKLNDNEVLLGTDQLYWQLVSLYEKQKTLDLLESQLNMLLKDVQVSYDVGMITLNDVLQVKLKLNELKSKRVHLDNGVSLAKMSLCQKTGIEIDSYAQFEIEKMDMSQVPFPPDMYVNHREVLNNRAENILLEKSIRASQLQTKIKRADYMPAIAIGGAYYKHDFMDSWDDNGIVFVSLKIPLSGWWGGSHVVRKQKINEQIALNNKTDSQEQMLLQMQQVRNELNDAYKQILIAEESIGQATENLRLNNDYYKAGTVNLSDVLDAQAFLQQNRDKYVDAYAHYRQKSFEYWLVTGH